MHLETLETFAFNWLGHPCVFGILWGIVKAHVCDGLLSRGTGLLVVEDELHWYGCRVVNARYAFSLTS